MNDSSSLRLEARFDDPDTVYEDLVRAHAGLDAEASAALNARLVLVLANHIGNVDVVRRAIALARDGMRQRAD